MFPHLHVLLSFRREIQAAPCFFRTALSGHAGGVLEVRGGVSCAFTLVGR